MRPLRLELEGFTAFRNRTVVDFANLDLFAIWGPTGAGKSSLIDAICYALYGRIPRVNNEIAACISQGIDRLQVTLEFRAGDQDYRVFRETRRRGAPNVRLEYLLSTEERFPPLSPVGAGGRGRGPSDASATGWQPLTQGARDVTDRIEHIVGLTYDGFTRSVLLPQGQFEEFLAGSPDKRRDVLRSLLRLEVYETMRDRAAGIAREQSAALGVMDTTLRDQFADATPETLIARQAAQAQAEAEAGRLAASLNDLDLITTAAERFEAAQADVLRLTAEAGLLEAKLAEARSLVDRGGAETEALNTQIAGLSAALAANPYDDQLLAALTGAANLALALQRDERALQEAEKAVVGLESRLAAALAATAAADSALGVSAGSLAAAQGRLEEARRHDLAAAIQAGLKPGDRCPVCGGNVGSLPDLTGSSLAAAQTELKGALANDHDARAAAAAAATAVAVATSGRDTTRGQVGILDSQATERRSELAAALPNFPDPSVATITNLLQAQREARADRDKVRTQLDALESALKEKQTAFADARQAVAVLADRAQTATAALASNQDSLSDALSCLAAALSSGAWPGLTLAFESHGPVSGAARALRDRTAAAEREALTAAGRLAADVDRITNAIAAAARLREEKRCLEDEHHVVADLGQMLMANRFQAYVQAEALRLLAQDGSARLRELSSGRYTLAVSDNGQEFEVVDEWNAGDRRSVRTLSGGETFLASLALALALAETLPGLAAGRRMALESVFLDEGFGSLDAESLRLAADALDSLRSGGRMVCVVTHLPELAERLPARIEVTKSETGSTVAVA